jgi:hypothetical protein
LASLIRLLLERHCLVNGYLSLPTRVAEIYDPPRGFSETS